MFEDSKRGMKEGAVAGLIAGLTMAVLGALFAATAGQHPLLPLQVSASVLLGPEAFTSATAGSLVVGPAIVALFGTWLGLLYGAIVGTVKQTWRTSWLAEALMGTVFGVVVWLVTIPIVGQWAYPWMLETSQPAELLLFALGYGLPLGLLVAHAEHQPTVLAASHA